MALHPLEARLLDWAHEYAGGKYEHNGWSSRNWLANMMEYGGRAPDGLRGNVVSIGTPADDVEEAVKALESIDGGFKPGRVLRAEYWMAHSAEESRLQHLRAIGLPMSRAGYYMHLKTAKVHVAAWLRIGFDKAA